MIVLGSTGSIGVSTLELAHQYRLPVEVLVAGSNIERLNDQVALHQPRIVVVADQENVPRVHHHRVLFGEEGIIEALQSASSELVVNALVGFLGLKPTLEALRLGKKLALANKESLVAAGKFIDSSRIVPIDSEHFGLQFLLKEGLTVEQMVITASGGAFRDTPIEQIANSSVESALKHPNWKMGPKITIDSATMANKLFEILEAYWLFGITNLDAVIETKSLFHALIRFADGSLSAHIAHADMKLPIAHAILDHIDEPLVPPVDLLALGSFEFTPINSCRYPIWEIKDDLLQKPELGVVVNAANEKAVEAFLGGRIPFGEISRKTLEAYKTFENLEISSLEELFDIDHEVRRFVEKGVA